MSSMLWKAREMTRLRYEQAKADISGKIHMMREEHAEERAAIKKAVKKETRKQKIKKALRKVRQDFNDSKKPKNIFGERRDLFP